MNAKCAELMGWKPPGHPDTQAERKGYPPEDFYDECWLHPTPHCGLIHPSRHEAWFRPLHDANAAAELRRAMGDGFQMRLVWGPMWLACSGVGETWERASNENAVTVYCFLKFHDLDLRAIARGE